MKTFADLKIRDKIYYWSHGKIYEQTIHRFEECLEVKSYTLPNGTKTTYDDKYIIFQAGKGKTYNISDYRLSNNSMYMGCTIKFADYDALIQWLKSVKNETLRQFLKIEKRYNKLKNCLYIYENYIKI